MRPSPLALTVLSLLAYEPLHPYRMQRLIQLWGKDRVVNVGQRANLYKTIKRLHEAGLVAVRQTERDQQYPERTVYELTEAGREPAVAWLTEMLSAPRNEFPEFPAALSFVMLLDPEEALAGAGAPGRPFSARAWPGSCATWRVLTRLPRVTLLETEYLRAVPRPSSDWVSGVIDDLRSGALTWSEEELAGMATEQLPGLVTDELAEL